MTLLEDCYFYAELCVFAAALYFSPGELLRSLRLCVRVGMAKSVRSSLHQYSLNATIYIVWCNDRIAYQ